MCAGLLLYFLSPSPQAHAARMCSVVERAVVTMELADVPAVVAACGRDILTRSLVWCRDNAELVAGELQDRPVAALDSKLLIPPPPFFSRRDSTAKCAMLCLPWRLSYVFVR